jgi:hypothetical protein
MIEIIRLYYKWIIIIYKILYEILWVENIFK